MGSNLVRLEYFKCVLPYLLNLNIVRYLQIRDGRPWKDYTKVSVSLLCVRRSVTKVNRPFDNVCTRSIPGLGWSRVRVGRVRDRVGIGLG